MINTPSSTKRIVMLAYNNAELLDISGPLDVFSHANNCVSGPRKAPYSIEIMAADSGLVTTSSGIQVSASSSYLDNSKAIDTLLVAGGDALTAMKDKSLIQFIKHNALVARRTASICTGAFLLAEAGLLDNKTATTHWRAVTAFKQRFPHIHVDANAIYVKQENIYTSAGITAGIDLALALVKEDLGKHISLQVAKGMVMYLHRPGGQSQFSDLLDQQHTADDDFSALHDWLLNNLSKPLTVDAMAQQCAMSPRHFARKFSEVFQTSPAKYLETLRVHKSCLLIEQGGKPLKVIASLSGFTSVEQLRRSFKRLLKVTPQDYQLRF